MTARVPARASRPSTAGPGFRRDTEAVVDRADPSRRHHGGRSAGPLCLRPKAAMYPRCSRCSTVLEARGYLPRESPHRGEICGGTRDLSNATGRGGDPGRQYLSSQNRLTLIHAELTLSSGDEVIWRSTPQVRSAVPLPKLPAYLARRIAVRPERSDEFERTALQERARSNRPEVSDWPSSSMPPARSAAPAR